MTDKFSERVYSTAKEDPVCQKCGKTPCRCSEPAPVPMKGQTARIQLDRKGRKGKSVTLIQGLTLPAAQMEQLAKTLKGALGTGGTFKEGQLEIQGDHRAKIVDLLQKQGYRTKLVGG
jgi:translation initiation factor 1